MVGKSFADCRFSTAHESGQNNAVSAHRANYKDNTASGRFESAVEDLAEIDAANTLGDIMSRNGIWNRQGMIVLLLLMLAAALRLSLLGSKSLWFDEAFSVSFARSSIAHIWQPNFVRPETHPPLYYHGLHYWMNWFGDSETSVRLPSALISLLNVGLIYVLGRRLFNHRVGLLAAGLLAVSPLHIWFAQEARMSVFMTTILLLASILLSWDSWWALPSLAVTFAIGLYIDYTMLPIWALLSALWIVSWWRRGHPWRPFVIWAAASLIAWLIFTPWLTDFYEFLEIFSTLHLFIRLNETLGLPFLSPAQYLVVLATAATVMIPLTAILLSLIQNERSGRWISAAVLVGFVIATLVFTLPRLYSLKRVLVQIWPLVILWVAWIVDQAGPWRQRTASALLALSLAASVILLLAIPKDDWRGAVNYVNTQAGDNDLAWLDPAFNWMATSYYDLALPIETSHSGFIPENEAGDIWLFAERFPGRDIPSSASEQMLDDDYDFVEAVPFYRLEVRRYRIRVQ